MYDDEMMCEFNLQLMNNVELDMTNRQSNQTDNKTKGQFDNLNLINSLTCLT